MTAVRTELRGLGVLTDVLLAQVEPDDVEELSTVADAAGTGLVVSGDKYTKMIIRHLRSRGFRQPLLPDRQRYKGKNRLEASHPFDPNWISWQRELDLPVIVPDAGYVAEGDLAGLQSVLRCSAAIPGAIAPLALANWWFYGPGLRFLLTELADVETPIAVIIEHASDPFSARRVLDGLLTVIRTGIHVIPLRCDISSVGLIAHGALAAGYGSKTSLRHLYPQRKGGGGGASGKESAMWPTGMALHYRDLLHDAVLGSPRAPHWRCSCAICAGSRLDRLATTSVYEVRRHNFACMLDLRHQIAALATGADRTRSWTSWCRSGEEAHNSVDAGPVSLVVPKALRHWQTF